MKIKYKDMRSGFCEFVSVPLEKNFAKVQMFALQLQFWADTPAGEVDDYILRIVFDFTN